MGRWARELGLGARIAMGGGREGRWRMVLTGLGVAFGVAVLLAAASLPTVIAAQQDRTAQRSEDLLGPEVRRPGPDTLLVGATETAYRYDAIRGRLLAPEGPEAPLPPGLRRFPRPGEVFVSPALARRLRSPDGALLRPRLGGRVVGTIADAGLASPSELAFYAGSDRLAVDLSSVVRIDHFGTPREGAALDPVLLLLVVVVVIVLLMPVAVFVATAARFGGERRDRRLAALRLVGADRAMSARLAAGEACVGAVLGLVAGTALFLLGRALAIRVVLWDFSAFPADVRPVPVLAAVVAVGVPGAAIAVTMLAMRRIVVEPLGVVRGAPGRRRRLGWRLALPVAGVVLLVPLLGQVSQTGSRVSSPQVAAGVALLLAGITAVLPWLVDRTVARLGGGPVPWQLAVRRLQLDSGATTRTVAGIAVALAGAIALQMLVAGVQHDYERDTGQDATRAQAELTLPAATAPDAERRLRDTPGVSAVYGLRRWEVDVPGGAGDATGLTVARCAVLRELAALERCREGDAFIADAGDALVLRPGQGVRVAGRAWRLPERVRRVEARADPGGSYNGGILATPAVLPSRVRSGEALQLLVAVVPGRGRADAIERVRTTAAGVDPTAYVNVLVPRIRAARFAALRRAMLAGAVIVLALIGASLLVGVVQELQERRPVLAVLMAYGTRRRTLGSSILIQAGVPVALGIGLAVATGAVLGALLLRIVGEPVRLDPAGAAAMAGAGALVVMAVCALSLPVLWRATRPEGLRSE